MAFKGTLKEFKVPDILQLISLQKKSGILTFNSNEGFITVIFEDGAIVGVDAFPKKLEMRVGSVLVKQDIISEEMLQRALAIQKRTGQKVGEILIGMGLIDERSIPEALKTQAVQIILSLFTWKKGEYNFKVMDGIDDQMKTLEPIPADHVIMEGVQMLDEWPLIRRTIYSDEMVFEAIDLGNLRVEIISEYDEEKEYRSDGKTVYLNDTEVSLLKHINGRHSVRDLVELGIFTEYKIYKNLFNLVNKAVIRQKEIEPEVPVVERPRTEAAAPADTRRHDRLLFRVLLALLAVIFLLSLWRPLRPLHGGHLLVKDTLIQTAAAGAAR